MSRPAAIVIATLSRITVLLRNAWLGAWSDTPPKFHLKPKPSLPSVAKTKRDLKKWSGNYLPYLTGDYGPGVSYKVATPQASVIGVCALYSGDSTGQCNWCVPPYKVVTPQASVIGVSPLYSGIVSGS